MASYQVEVPRWISLFTLIFGIIFGFVWLQSAYKSGNMFFVLLGILFFIAFVGIAIYTLVTGKSPYKLTQSK